MGTIETKNELIRKLVHQFDEERNKNKNKLCIDDIQFKSEYSETLIKMQILQKAGHVCSKSKKDFDLLSYSKPPVGYKYGRQFYQDPLQSMNNEWSNDVDSSSFFL